MYEGSVKIVCRNDLAETERVHRVVTQFCELHQIAPRALHAITLALDEVLTNIVRYAYGDGAPHEIRVSLTHTPGTLIAQIEDDGQPFNPLTVAPVDVTKPLSAREIGGLGIHLVRSLMNDVQYEQKEGRNVLTLTKKIRSSSKS